MMASLQDIDAPSATVVPPNPSNTASVSNHPLRKSAAILSAPHLRFDRDVPEEEIVGAVPTAHTTPRIPPPRRKPRLFGLEDCPIFYPTAEEFLDPMKYIEQISSPEGGNGRAYGIVKIVPPEGWHPPFVLDQDVSSR